MEINIDVACDREIKHHHEQHNHQVMPIVLVLVHGEM